MNINNQTISKTSYEEEYFQNFFSNESVCTDLATNIFNDLDFKNLAKASQVCKNWSEFSLKQQKELSKNLPHIFLESFKKNRGVIEEKVLEDVFRPNNWFGADHEYSSETIKILLKNGLKVTLDVLVLAVERKASCEMFETLLQEYNGPLKPVRNVANILKSPQNIKDAIDRRSQEIQANG